MSTIEQTVFCYGCGVEIYWAPVIHHHKPYCCQDCQEGRGCECARRQELEDDRQTRKESYPLGTS